MYSELGRWQISGDAKIQHPGQQLFLKADEENYTNPKRQHALNVLIISKGGFLKNDGCATRSLICTCVAFSKHYKFA